MNKKIYLNGLGIVLFLLFCSIASAITIQEVSNSPEEVEPGKIVTISVKIENIFEEDVKNLEVKLDLENTPLAPYQSSSEIFLEELKGGRKETFDFELIVLPETSSGIYKIPVNINYDLEGDERTKNDLISITINSGPELKLSLENSILIKGKENEISVRIINSGLSDVRFVYLKVSDVSGVEFITNNQQYIGDLDSNDFESVEYSLLIDQTAPSKINIPVILEYKDSTNKEYTETKTIPAIIYSFDEAKEKGLIKKENYLVYFLLPLLIIGFIFYKILKKRKLKKKRKLEE